MAREGISPRWQGDVVRPFVKKLAQRRLLSFDRTAFVELTFRRMLGQPLSPHAWSRMTLNDKVTYRRLCDRDPLWLVLSDKLRMRDYIEERMGAESLPKLLAVGDHAHEFEGMRGPFVLKANHGSGMTILVDDGELLTPDELAEAETWSTQDCEWPDLEWGYSGARRLLLAEERLYGPGRPGPPSDYKFFTFSGEPELIQVDIERFGDHRRMLRRPNWELVQARINPLYDLPDDPQIPAPRNLELMLEWASVLGRSLEFIRVDLYDLEERVLVGELTPYPGAGSSWFDPRSLDAWLGSRWLNPPRTRGLLR